MKASFKPVGQNNTPAPAPVTQEAEVIEQHETTCDPSQALAIRTAGQLARPSYTFGGEDDADAGDIRWPHVNVVQSMSDPALKRFGEGHIVLAKEIDLGVSARVIVVGFGPLKFIEKTKYVKGINSNARIVNSVQDVEAANGTTLWRESKENDKIKSDKPWFMKSRNALLLIEKPEGVDDARFTFVAGDKHFAAALFGVKSTSYESFYVRLNSENKTGTLREGFYSRFIELAAPATVFSGGTAYNPQPKVLEKAPDEVVKLALSLRG